MASSITLRSLLLRLPKSTVVPGASSRRYYSTNVSSSGHRDTADASSCIAEFQGPVGRFVVNPLRTALYYFIDTIYPYTPTKNLRWSLNLMNTVHTPACGRSLRAFIKCSVLGSGWNVTETPKTLRIFRDMRGLKQDVKVWVEEGTKLTEFGEVKLWVENGNLVSDEGPKVLGYLLGRDVYGIESSRTVYLNPSVTPFMKPEELKRSEYTGGYKTPFGNEGCKWYGFSITYPEMPYPSVSLFIKHETQKGSEGKDFVEPYTARIGLPGNVYKTNDIKIEVKNELLKVIVPKMTVKRVSNLNSIFEISDPASR